jgi:hypothetical protein
MENPHSAPTNVQFTAPSVTTYWNMNPAYRVWTADGDDGRLLDAETYYADLKTAADGGRYRGESEPLEWKLLYSAKKEYDMPDLSPASWNAVIGKVLTQPEYTQKFMRFVKE